MSDIEFIDGLNAKAPNQGVPEYVKAKLSIRREALIAYLQQRDGEWINAEIKESKGGKWYVAVDSWKPNSEKSGQSDRPQRQERQAPADSGFADDSSDIPF